MIKREQLSALLNKIDQDIIAYLRKISYCVVSDQEKLGLGKMLGRFEANGIKYGISKNGSEDVVVYGGGNNLELSALRVASLLRLKHELDEISKNVNQNQNLEGTIEVVRNLVQDAVEENARQNSTHAKHHQSYRQNRLAGGSIFSSWWHKSWCQSRALSALEHALDHIESFVGKTQQTGLRPAAQVRS